MPHLHGSPAFTCLILEEWGEEEGRAERSRAAAEPRGQTLRCLPRIQLVPSLRSLWAPVGCPGSEMSCVSPPTALGRLTAPGPPPARGRCARSPAQSCWGAGLAAGAGLGDSSPSARVAGELGCCLRGRVVESGGFVLPPAGDSVRGLALVNVGLRRVRRLSVRGGAWSRFLPVLAGNGLSQRELREVTAGWFCAVGAARLATPAGDGKDVLIRGVNTRGEYYGRTIINVSITSGGSRFGVCAYCFVVGLFCL